MGRIARILLVLYCVLLVVSWVVRWVRSDEAPPPTAPSLEVAAVDGARTTDGRVRLVFDELGPDEGPDGTAVILLHGSPGNRHDFRSAAPVLARRHRVIAPDLPGFGESTLQVPDYSLVAHADYVLQLMDALAIRRAHLVGFSMGGGVGLSLYDRAPDRVLSLTLLSAIGVQELELFGNYPMNHAVHGAQLGGMWLLVHGFPHFGGLDRAFFGLPYCRNFYDTDQRPLRGILERFEPPMLVVHGEDDFLVPAQAAREHHRVVPHSELQMLRGSHFLIFRRGEEIGARLARFVGSVDRGEAPVRAGAEATRVVAAAGPRLPPPPFTGFALILMLVLIVVSTLVTEDLTCIGVGLMVAQGRLEFLPGVAACCFGIFIGDVGLYLAGRWLGRPAIRRAPLRWMIGVDSVDASSDWFRRRGPIVIVLSRFAPGFRIPTYFAAGLLHTSFLKFCGYFVLAVVLWTPALVGAATLAGEGAFEYFETFQEHAIWAFVALGLWILIVVKLILPLFSWRGRRRMVGRWRRLTRWEFWPPWVFYPPVLAWVVWLGIRHRSPLLFTAANPAIEAGGFISESKWEILRGLEDSGSYIAAAQLVPCDADVAARAAVVRSFMTSRGLDFPVVLKPDTGQRGSGVAVVRDVAAVEAYLSAAPYEVVVQEYVPGHELGIFYVRRPDEDEGRIISITDKRMPEVVGDGRSTVEELILADPRAVAMADHYLAAQAARRADVPADGETIQLVELGTHCRGAIFLDGSAFETDELRRAIDRVSRSFDGFFFGRYDVRVFEPDVLPHGAGFKVIELNGVTSEATHIYDPSLSLLEAYRTLFRQWALAFEIGRENKRRGVQPTTFRELLHLLQTYRKTSRFHNQTKA
ncbi:MAG: alpha/beta fold hydrolase [bacterium]|nr:alpha/beta fold hydrolase [bacterium]